MRSLLRIAAVRLLAGGAGVVPAQELIGKKELFALPAHTTANGQTIGNVRVGHQTAGKRHAAHDNAIVVCHFYSGTSHAFGGYSAADKAAGYWDAIIGLGEPIAEFLVR